MSAWSETLWRRFWPRFRLCFLIEILINPKHLNRRRYIVENFTVHNAVQRFTYRVTCGGGESLHEERLNCVEIWVSVANKFVAFRVAIEHFDRCGDRMPMVESDAKGQLQSLSRLNCWVKRGVFGAMEVCVALCDKTHISVVRSTQWNHQRWILRNQKSLIIRLIWIRTRLRRFHRGSALVKFSI